jgi:hypothetical protein
MGPMPNLISDELRGALHHRYRHLGPLGCQAQASGLLRLWARRASNPDDIRHPDSIETELRFLEGLFDLQHLRRALRQSYARD